MWHLSLITVLLSAVSPANGVPLGIFCVACYYADGKVQLALAKLLTLVYTVIMLIVYVGTFVKASIMVSQKF